MRQATRARLRRSPLPRRASHDCRPSPVARSRAEGRRRPADDPRSLRVRARNTVADRSGIDQARVPPAGRGRAGAAGARPRRRRTARGVGRRVPGSPDAREPHAQAGVDRSAPLQRHRQRVLRRDPARRPPVAARADALAQRRGGRAPARGGARHAHGLDRAPAGRGRRRVPREGDGVPRGDGRARTVPASVSRVRQPGAADRVRRQRVQLLRAVPDGGPGAGRPIAVAPARRATGPGAWSDRGRGLPKPNQSM